MRQSFPLPGQMPDQLNSEKMPCWLVICGDIGDKPNPKPICVLCAGVDGGSEHADCAGARGQVNRQPTAQRNQRMEDEVLRLSAKSCRPDSVCPFTVSYLYSQCTVTLLNIYTLTEVILSSPLYIFSAFSFLLSVPVFFCCR